jgi:hypothetical protein
MLSVLEVSTRCFFLAGCPSLESEVADNLSRERTTGFLEKQMLNRPQKKADLRVLTDWLKNPAEDWTIVDRLVDHVISTCTS